jgi:hypothetical protein
VRRAVLAIAVAACSSRSGPPPAPALPQLPPAPQVETDGALAIADGSAPPVAIVIDAHQRVSIAAADSWWDLAAWKLSAGPRSVTSVELADKALRAARIAKQLPKQTVESAVIVEPPPPPENGSDDSDESGGSSVMMALDEDKLAKHEREDETERELHLLAGNPGEVIQVHDREKRVDAESFADVVGEVPRDHAPDANAHAIVIVDPSNRASVLVDAVTHTEGMIAVQDRGALRPLRLHFTGAMFFEPERWLEVRITATGLEVEGVPEAITAVPWTSGPLDRKALAAALEAAHRGWHIPAIAQVDVLASPDTPVQRMIDVLVALDVLGVREIGLGATPAAGGHQAQLRGHRPPPHVRYGLPYVDGALDRKQIRAAVLAQDAALMACYQPLVAADHELAGTVVTHFTISSSGKVTAITSSGGAEPHLAPCVKSVIAKIVFPKPASRTAEVNYRLRFQN